MRSRVYRDPCGCKYTNEPSRWLELCVAHKAEHDEIHQRAVVDYRRTSRGKVSEPESPTGITVRAS